MGGMRYERADVNAKAKRQKYLSVYVIVKLDSYLYLIYSFMQKNASSLSSMLDEFDSYLDSLSSDVCINDDSITRNDDNLVMTENETWMEHSSR